jgi:enolase
MKIRKVLCSKAKPTIEVEIGSVKGSCPYGTSTSSKEPPMFKEEKYLPELVNKIKKNIYDLEKCENILNEYIYKVGAAYTVAISVCLHKFHAELQKEPLFQFISEFYDTKTKEVLPLENFIGGKAHGGIIDIQEVLVTKKGKMKEVIFELAEKYNELREILKNMDKNFKGQVDLESAFVAKVDIENIINILKDMGLEIGFDFAANDYYDGFYNFEGKKLSKEEYFERVIKLSKYAFYLEDPFSEEDIELFKKLNSRIKYVVGDDLFSTNPEILKKYKDCASGIILKLNQAGTVSRLVETFKLAKSFNYITIVSHRSGETEDNFISHLAVGLGSDYIKCGAAGIRVAKLNELIRISEIM